MPTSLSMEQVLDLVLIAGQPVEEGSLQEFHADHWFCTACTHAINRQENVYFAISAYLDNNQFQLDCHHKNTQVHSILMDH